MLITVVLVFVVLSVLVLSPLQLPFKIPKVKAEEPNVFGNPTLPNWQNITVTVASDGKSFTIDNADNLTWIFEYGAKKYNSIYQSGVQIVKDELWMLQYYDGSWKDVGSSVNVFYEQATSYNVKVTQFYTSINGDYNVTWDFYGGFRPKITVLANIVVAGNYRVDWRTYVYKDYAVNMTNYVKFWNLDEEAIVFDYSDVYEAFGNITVVEGVEGWEKGKRFDLIFNVGFLSVGEFRLDPNFGYETESGSGSSNTNQIRASWFTCPESGTADSISVYTRAVTSAPMKCAIYKKSDNSLVGVTEQITLESTVQWHVFNFTAPKPSLQNIDYWLAMWLDGGTSYYYYVSETEKGAYQNLAYNSFPDPFVPINSNRKTCIYCTYTAGGAEDETAPTYSDVGTNTTIAGNPCLFSTKWTDETGLATTGGYIFGTNNTGTPTNETWTAFTANPDWSNKTLTLNSTVGYVIQWWIYANDTSDNWNNTGTQSLTTAFYSEISVDETFSWNINPGQNNVTINEEVINLTTSANSAYDIQVKGSGDLTNGSYSIALNNVLVENDTLADAIALTTEYQDIPGLTNLPSGTDVELTFILWLSCPVGRLPLVYSFTLYVKVKKAS